MRPADSRFAGERRSARCIEAPLPQTLKKKFADWFAGNHPDK